MTTDEQKMKNSERQRKHYEKHRDAINAKKRERYQAGKKVLENPIVENVEPVLDLSKQKTLTYEECKTYLSGLTYGKEGSKTKYLEDLKRLHKIIDCDNYITCLKDPEDVKEQLSNAKQANGKPYADNTLKSLYQLILFMIDNFKIPVKKNGFTQEYEINKIKSTDNTQKKQEEEEIIPFNEYLEKVKQQFGETSQMYLLSKLYEFISLRDNFFELIITDKVINDKDSFIIITQRSKKARIIINDYKTIDKYGKIDVLLPEPLTKMIKTYITTHTLNQGDYLFGTGKKLSSFVSKNNKKIGIEGAITYYRKMAVSDLMNKEGVSAEERYAKAKLMTHSPIVQGSVYFRKHKK